MYVYACTVPQLCPTLCSPMNCSPPSSSVHGILQQEYGSGLPFPTPGDLPSPGIKPVSLGSYTGRQILDHCATWEASIQVCTHSYYIEFVLTEHRAWCPWPSGTLAVWRWMRVRIDLADFHTSPMCQVRLGSWCCTFRSTAGGSLDTGHGKGGCSSGRRSTSPEAHSYQLVRIQALF